MKRKSLSILLVSLVILTMFAFPAAAVSHPVNSERSVLMAEVVPRANGYFNGSTGTMSSFYGMPSARFNVSSGTIPSESTVTSVSASVTLSSGSGPIVLVIVSPRGIEGEQTLSRSGTVTYNDFTGTYPAGTWQIYCYNPTGGISTATARMTVNYFYG